MNMAFRVPQSDREEAVPVLYLPGGSLYRPTHDSFIDIHKERSKERIVVTGAFPKRQNESGVLVETVRDPENLERLLFLHWEKGSTNILHYIEREGRIFLPPDPSSRSFPPVEPS